MSSTLRISNISPDTTLDDLRFFFENTWKSGGGPVCDIEINDREHTALVMFEEKDGKNISLYELYYMLLISDVSAGYCM